MKCYFRFYLIPTRLGTIPLGNFIPYYNTKSAQHDDWVAICISRDRFKLLCNTICLDDEDTRTIRAFTNKKFLKFDEIIGNFKSKLQSGLKASANTCIDEQLYKFRGRCPFKQNIPSKPAKYGVKYWSWVFLQTGYLLNSDIYLVMHTL